MLQFFHEYKGSFLMIFVVIVVAFVMTSFGIDFYGGRRAEDAIRVNERAISYEEFYDRKNLLEERYRKLFGEHYGRVASSLRLGEQVINQFINEALAEQLADELGIVASPQQLVRLLVSGGYLRRGMMLEEYKELLASIEPQLMLEFTNLARRQQLIQAIRDVSFLTIKEASSQIKRRETTYDISYLELDPKLFVNELPKPKEEELKAIYEENIDEFKQPPAVKYKFVSFGKDEIMDMIEVTEEDIQQYYNTHKHEFRAPDRARVRHIELHFPEKGGPEEINKVKETALELRDRILAGEDMSELALEYSEDYMSKTIGGDMGWITSKDNTPIARKVFSGMKVGDVDIVETDYGYHVVRVEELEKSRVKQLEEVRDKIVNKLKEELLPVYATAMANEFFEEWIKSGMPLDSFAATKGKRVYISADKAIVGKDLEGFSGLTEKVLKDPHNTKKVIDLNDKVVVVEIVNYYLPDVLQFEAVKKKVIKIWKKRKSKEFASRKAKDIINGLMSGSYKSIDDVAKSLRIIKGKIVAVKLTQPSKGVAQSKELRETLLSIDRGGTLLSKPFEYLGKIYVIKVDSVKRPEGASLRNRALKERRSLGDELGSLIFASVLARLKAEADVEVNVPY